MIIFHQFAFLDIKMKNIILFINSCLLLNALAAPALPVNSPQEKFESYFPISDSGYGKLSTLSLSKFLLKIIIITDFGTFLTQDQPEIKSNDDVTHPKVATEAVVDTPDFKPEEIPDDMNVQVQPTVGTPDAFVINTNSEQFMPPPNGEKPKFTGSFVPGIEFGVLPDSKSNDNEDVAVTNPASYYLEGAKLDKVSNLFI